MAFNVDHAANNSLNAESVNNERGLSLHQFNWLDDDMIGALPPGVELDTRRVGAARRPGDRAFSRRWTLVSVFPPRTVRRRMALSLGTMGQVSDGEPR